VNYTGEKNDQKFNAMTTYQKHKSALRRFHGLCRELGISDENKRAVIQGEGVESSADISTYRLHAICDELKAQSDPKTAQMDALRKRVMASVGGWLKAAGYTSNSEVIKAVACRASGYDNFNKIPAARLHNLYHNFRNKQIDKQTADSLMSDLLTNKTSIAGVNSACDKLVN